MTTTETRPPLDLIIGAVYMVTTTDDESLIGAYAGTENGRAVFSTGVYSPLAIPEHKIREAERIGG